MRSRLPLGEDWAWRKRTTARAGSVHGPKRGELWAEAGKFGTGQRRERVGAELGSWERETFPLCAASLIVVQCSEVAILSPSVQSCLSLHHELLEYKNCIVCIPGTQLGVVDLCVPRRGIPTDKRPLFSHITALKIMPYFSLLSIE